MTLKPINELTDTPDQIAVKRKMARSWTNYVMETYRNGIWYAVIKND